MGLTAVETFDGSIEALPARIEPASRPIGASAAELRARFGPSLKLPDPLVIATAQVLTTDRINTTDQGRPGTGIRVDTVEGRR